MADRRKRPEPPSEEGSPAWMNTYGDMVTLVLTFFVLLFSFSTIDAVKWEEIVNSFTGTRFRIIEPLDPNVVSGPGGDLSVEEQPDYDEKDPETDKGMENAKLEFNELYKKIKQHIKENKLEASLNVEKNGNVILLRITDSTLFDSGKDKIKPEAKKILKKVAGIFGEHEKSINMIRIEGHTDNVPMHSAKYESNKMLSVGRAVSVWEYLTGISKIEDGRYSATGYGEYHPIASNDTEEGKAKNRRVDFVIESVAKN